MSNTTNTTTACPVDVRELTKRVNKKAKWNKQHYEPRNQSLLHHYVDAPPELKGIGGIAHEPLLDLVVGGDVFLSMRTK